MCIDTPLMLYVSQLLRFLVPLYCASNISRIGVENMEYMYTLNVINLANVVGAKTEPSYYLPGC